jgi:putative NADH-flavin reductase
MMKITVLGANGKTGVALVKQAVAAGHTVTGLVRKNDTAKSNPKVRYVVGDATNTQSVIEASKGSDAIISVLGGTNSSLITSAMKAVVDSSKVTGVKRVILMSSFAVETSKLQGIAKLVGRLGKKMINDKATGEDILRKRDLDWTIVYATVLTNEPKGSGVRVIPSGERISLKNKISRADVAAWILNEAEKNEFIKANVTVSR